MLRAAALSLLVLLLAPVDVTGQSLPKVIVVFDLTANDGELDDPANATYAFAVRDDEADEALRDALRRAATDSATAATNGTALLEAIRAERPAATDLRSFVARGEVVEAYAFHHRPSEVTFEFDEVARSSRLQSDIAALVKVAARILEASAAMDPGNDPTLKVTAKRYTLSKPRAVLTVTAELGESEETPAVAAPAGAAEGTAPAKAVAADVTPQSHSVSITTGRREHFFLSANAGAATVSTLEYDEDTGNLEPGEAPTSFFVGINFSLADLYVAPEGPLDELAEAGLYIGGLVEASSRPMDQIALIGGFRHNPLRFLAPFLSFEVVSPYAGVLWTRNDAVEEDGKVLRGANYGKGRFLWGVSLNLDRALEWLSPKEEETKSEGEAAQDPPAGQ